MALLLNIETTTTNCSVSLSENGKTIAIKEDNSPGYSHAELLHLYIKAIIENTNISPQNIDAIAVSMGPGSYTGLRIGVSTAKGLSYALDKPLIAIDTLKSLAKKVNPNTPNNYIVPMLDARRMEIYTAVFTANYQTIKPTEALVLTSDSFHEFLQQGIVYFIGNGVEKTSKIINHPNAKFIENELPSADQIGGLADLKFNQNQFEDVAYFEPFYLKDFLVSKPTKSLPL